MLRQRGMHGAVAGKGDAVALQLLQGPWGRFVLAANQNIGAFQVRPADLQVLVDQPGDGQGGDHVSAAILQAGDHVGNATGPLYLEAQAGPQANELKQVSSDAAKMPRAIEVGQGRSRVVDGHTHHRVLLQPLLLCCAQLQVAVGQQQVAAGAPAFEDTGAHGGGLAIEDGIDQFPQYGVLLAQGKAEADGFVLAEVGHAQAWQVAAVELVVGGNGVADEHVGLAERYGVQRLA